VPLYTYKAVNPDGRLVFGRIDAINLVDLELRLRRMELDLVSGEPLSNRSLLGGGGVPRREIIHFCFHLQQLVRAGVPVLEGLTDLRDSLEHPRFPRGGGQPDRIDRGWPDAVAGHGQSSARLQPGLCQPDPRRRDDRSACRKYCRASTNR
jgi:hypothetical protein